MNKPLPKCYYCDKEGVIEKSVIVDCEADHEMDESGNEVWRMHPVKSMVWLCEEHQEMEGDEDE